MMILYTIIYATLSVSGVSLIKWQLNERKLDTLDEWISFAFNFYFVIASLLIVLSWLVLFKALSTNSLSLIIPIATGFNFILTICVGYYLFHDKLSLVSFVGFVMIIGGIVILSLNNQAHA
ncbi:hypothetical protein ACFS7Z_20480 [Pontibacter toksunensis]|uniref:EamA-like transporter family protein n=1 Tax=Pontibacter toksunensis TaxID=1332631 RepID=A0ABW6BY79_9BACT